MQIWVRCTRIFDRQAYPLCPPTPPAPRKTGISNAYFVFLFLFWCKKDIYGLAKYYTTFERVFKMTGKQSVQHSTKMWNSFIYFITRSALAFVSVSAYCILHMYLYLYLNMDLHLCPSVSFVWAAQPKKKNEKHKWKAKI